MPLLPSVCFTNVNIYTSMFNMLSQKAFSWFLRQCSPVSHTFLASLLNLISSHCCHLVFCLLLSLSASLCRVVIIRLPRNLYWCFVSLQVCSRAIVTWNSLPQTIDCFCQIGFKRVRKCIFTFVQFYYFSPLVFLATNVDFTRCTHIQPRVRVKLSMKMYLFYIWYTTHYDNSHSDAHYDDAYFISTEGNILIL